MVKIGLLATLFGPYQGLGEDGVRGAKLALEEHKAQNPESDIEFSIKSTDATPLATISALEEAYKEGIRLFVGPLSGNEALALRQFARRHPECTFVNGASGSQPVFSPAENFFMFNATGAQLMSGLGRYCYETLGYRKIATIGEAYSFPFAQIGGFAYDFVQSGGAIEKYSWCALGTQDYSTIIDEIPINVDAVYSSLGGTDGIHFIQQFQEKRSDTPLIAGSIFGDQSLLTFVTEHAKALTGVISASSHADDLNTPEAIHFRELYRKAYPQDGFYTPSFFAVYYYINTKALLLALQEVGTDETQLQEKLKHLRFKSPIGEIYLNHHRIAVIDTFINEIRQNEDGHLYTHLIKRVEKTTNTLGMDDETYLNVGKFSKDTMPTSTTNM